MSYTIHFHIYDEKGTLIDMLFRGDYQKFKTFIQNADDIINELIGVKENDKEKKYDRQAKS